MITKKRKIMRLLYHSKVVSSLVSAKRLGNSVHHFKMVPWQWQSRNKVWLPVQNLVGRGGGWGKEPSKRFGISTTNGHNRIMGTWANFGREQGPPPPPGKPQRSTQARNVNVFISYGELKTPLSILSCLFYVEIVMLKRYVIFDK